MALVRIKNGLDVQLEGQPTPEIVDAPNPATVSVFPREFKGIRPRLQVKEGDTVRRGSVLFFDKANEAFKFRSPAGGTVQSIVLGARRVLSEIVIEVADPEPSESFPSFDVSQITGMSRDELMAHLLDTGFLALLEQRPFSHIADPKVTPKSIFVNGMNTAPFLPSFGTVVKGEEGAFHAGLRVLTRLTEGKVHLCLPKNGKDTGPEIDRVEVHSFSGPHPSGNTSVHIHHLDPIKPHDIVWTIPAASVIELGQLFLSGQVPTHKIVSLGGPAVEEAHRKYYRVRRGAPLASLLEGKLKEGEVRLIDGDLLGGAQVEHNGGIRFYQQGITALLEGRERFFLGWMAPGLKRYSASPLYLSRWFRRAARWSLNTNLNGSRRAMVLTGLYDKYVPMRIKVDYLVRAVLAHDTEEAVQLGILETAPEDFALCAFACPSKMDLVGIMRKGIAEVEEQGL